MDVDFYHPPAPPQTSPASMQPTELNGISGESQRDTLAKYRPSDYQNRPSTAYRDSLMTGRQTDMGELLTELDENYRMSAATKAKTDEELSPLLKAAQTGDTAKVTSLLMETGTDILRRDPHHGQTAIHIAVRGGHMDVVRALCAPEVVRSIIDVPDNRRNTALHLAAAKSRRITKYLLEKGAEVDLYNMRNQTALGVHILTTKKDDPILSEMLLQYKADPNASIEQSSLIHVALDRSLTEIACRLVRHGARLDLKDENEKMAFDKVNRKTLRKLLSKISYPPVWVPNNERQNCMLCSKKFNKLALGTRRHHCRHCGRLCCGECAHLYVESVKFPKGFNNRLKNGAKANSEQKRVCKTCFSIFKEREAASSNDKAAGGNFYDRVVNVKWDEIEGQHNIPGGRNA